MATQVSLLSGAVASAGSLKLQTNGTTDAVTIDTSGNLGLGVTPSAGGATANYRLFEIGLSGGGSIYSGSGQTLFCTNVAWSGGTANYKSSSIAPLMYSQEAGTHIWKYAASGTAGNAITFTQAMTLDASGNLGVGTTTSDARATIEGSGTYTLSLNNTAQDIRIRLRQGGTEYGQVSAGSNLMNIVASGASTALRFITNSVEAARIDSSGNLLVGTTTAQGKISVEQAANTDSAYIQNNSSTLSNACNGVRIIYANSSPNNTTASFIRTGDSTAVRAEIRSNGGLANFSANNVNLSDERTKTDIQDAGNYLAKICAIPVRTFKYKDQTDDLLNLGCIAQEVEAVAPELVDVSGFGNTPEDGVPLKAIYQTDLQYALMKALQELKAEFDAYKATHP